MELKGRIAVVTGASRGIGRAVSQALLQEGAKVAAVSRDASRLDHAVRELLEGVPPSDGEVPSVLSLPADVGDSREVARLFARVAETYPRLDILVNAAGILRRGPLTDTSLEDWEESLRVNLTGVFLCSQAAARLMLAQQPGAGGVRGHIVQIVSGAGVHAWVGAGAYTASKWGVMGLSEVLRDEVRERGVKVTTVLPGMVDTDMTSHPDFAERHKLATDDVVHAIVAVLTAAPQTVLTRVDVRHLLPR